MSGGDYRWSESPGTSRRKTRTPRLLLTGTRSNDDATRRRHTVYQVDDPATSRAIEPMIIEICAISTFPSV